MTKLLRLLMSGFVALTGTLSVGCSDGGPGPKTEQAAGVGTIAVGAAVAPVCPPAGIAIVVVGAGITVHGAYREESGGGK